MTAVTWLGSASVRLDLADGRRVYLDPWLSGPTTPEGERDPERMDLILLTHGHVDHLGEAIALSMKHSAHIVAQTELTGWVAKNGGYLADPYGMNKGGTVSFDGLDVTMVYASHSSSSPELEYTGEGVGYVITMPDGKKVYVSGDTDVFLDMALIGELYEPDVAILSIGDRMTMGPRQAVKAIELLDVKRVLPYHWDAGGPLTPGRPDDLVRLLGPDSDVEVIRVAPGESFEL